jgi:HAD superfamily hydrolase (TIGR01450 family)
MAAGVFIRAGHGKSSVVPELSTLEKARAFVFDVDGTLALADDPNAGHGLQPLRGAADLLRHLRGRGARFVCFTNGTGQVPAEQAARLRAIGLPIDDAQLWTPANVAVGYLQRRHPGGAALAFGNEGLLGPLRAAGITLAPTDEAEGAVAVLVGADPEFSYLKLVAACRAVWAGAELLVTSMAPWFAARGGRMPSTSGAIAAGIVHVTGASPVVVGKPSPLVLPALASVLECAVSELVVVGDDVQLEIRMGREAGALTALVLSGTTSLLDLEEVPVELRPDVVLSDLGALLGQL